MVRKTPERKSLGAPKKLTLPKVKIGAKDKVAQYPVESLKSRADPLHPLNLPVVTRSMTRQFDAIRRATRAAGDGFRDSAFSSLFVGAGILAKGLSWGRNLENLAETETETSAATETSAPPETTSATETEKFERARADAGASGEAGTSPPRLAIAQFSAGVVGRDQTPPRPETDRVRPARPVTRSSEAQARLARKTPPLSRNSKTSVGGAASTRPGPVKRASAEDRSLTLPTRKASSTIVKLAAARQAGASAASTQIREKAARKCASSDTRPAKISKNSKSPSVGNVSPRSTASDKSGIETRMGTKLPSRLSLASKLPAVGIVPHAGSLKTTQKASSKSSETSLAMARKSRIVTRVTRVLESRLKDELSETQLSSGSRSDSPHPAGSITGPTAESEPMDISREELFDSGSQASFRTTSDSSVFPQSAGSSADTSADKMEERSASIGIAGAPTMVDSGTQTTAHDCSDIYENLTWSREHSPATRDGIGVMGESSTGSISGSQDHPQSQSTAGSAYDDDSSSTASESSTKRTLCSNCQQLFSDPPAEPFDVKATHEEMETNRQSGDQESSGFHAGDNRDEDNSGTGSSGLGKRPASRTPKPTPSVHQQSVGPLHGQTSDVDRPSSPPQSPSATLVLNHSRHSASISAEYDGSRVLVTTSSQDASDPQGVSHVRLPNGLSQLNLPVSPAGVSFLLLSLPPRIDDVDSSSRSASADTVSDATADSGQTTSDEADPRLLSTPFSDDEGPPTTMTARGVAGKSQERAWKKANPFLPKSSTTSPSEEQHSKQQERRAAEGEGAEAKPDDPVPRSGGKRAGTRLPTPPRDPKSPRPCDVEIDEALLISRSSSGGSLDTLDSLLNSNLDSSSTAEESCCDCERTAEDLKPALFETRGRRALESSGVSWSKRGVEHVSVSQRAERRFSPYDCDRSRRLEARGESRPSGNPKTDFNAARRASFQHAMGRRDADVAGTSRASGGGGGGVVLRSSCDGMSGSLRTASLRSQVLSATRQSLRNFRGVGRRPSTDPQKETRAREDDRRTSRRSPPRSSNATALAVIRSLRNEIRQPMNWESGDRSVPRSNGSRIDSAYLQAMTTREALSRIGLDVSARSTPQFGGQRWGLRTNMYERLRSLWK